MKLDLDLTAEEMLALGFALSAGQSAAISRGEPLIGRALSSLFQKISEANERMYEADRVRREEDQS